MVWCWKEGRDCASGALFVLLKVGSRALTGNYLCCSKDYYDILHVYRGADEATIKRAYRKLALKMHPDKVQGTEEEKRLAAEKFAEVGHGVSVAPCTGGGAGGELQFYFLCLTWLVYCLWLKCLCYTY